MPEFIIEAKARGYYATGYCKGELIRCENCRWWNKISHSKQGRCDRRQKHDT